MDKFLNKIICGDAVSLMKQLDDNSIDMVLTSPPYDSLRSYKGKIDKDITFNDHFSFPFVDMAKELYRITKDGGIVVWVVGDQVVDGGETGNSFRQALLFQEIGFKIYDTMIYHKNGAPFPETGRYSQVFEYMFILLKGKKPKTVNIIKDKENKWAGTSPYGKRTIRTVDGELKDTNSTFVVGKYGSRYNVWYINNGAGFSSKDKIAYQHPAIFPESLAEDHILSWSNEFDIVFDPMMGSGTTAKMARLNNRNFIGFDINEEYVQIANKRLESVIPYDDMNPNPKKGFIISREDILRGRKKKVD
jgi:site-specific DNA-methyltransferase (adenine-specific)